MKYVLIIASILLFTSTSSMAQFGKTDIPKGKDLVKEGTNAATAKGNEKAAEMKGKGKDQAKKEATKVVGSQVAEIAVEGADVLVETGKNAAIDAVKNGSKKKEDDTNSEVNDNVKSAANDVNDDTKVKGNPNAGGSEKPTIGNGNANSGNGNAYGKDKGELSGKEFGQVRATEAKAKNEATKVETKATIVKSEATVTEAESKITTAKAKNEADKNDKKITAEEYEAKKIQITQAEEKMNELKSKIQVGKEKTDK